MQISATSSAFSSGLNSVQSGQQRVNRAAGEIASISVEKPAKQAAGPVDSQAQPLDLAGSLVDLQIGKQQVQAGAEVIKSADDALGTLLDLHA